MTLGSNDAQTTQRLDLLMHGQPLGAHSSNFRLTLFLAQALIQLNALNVFFNVAAQHNVSAAASHVGGNGDHARASCLRNDVGLSCMLLGIEHLMRQLSFGEQF